MKSIIQTKKECYFCHTTKGLHKHHIYGASNRKNSEKHGFTVYLCPEHHNMSNDSVHRDTHMNNALKALCQRTFEETHTREDFMKIIGRNYIE